MTAIKQTFSEDEAAQALLREARALLKSDEERRFFDMLFAAAGSEDIDRDTAQELAALARMGWGQARQHKPGEIQIAILPGGNAQDPENVVVAVNDDRPFLFDSALAAAIAAGARIRAAFHPLLDIAGKPTSVIVLVMDAMSGGIAQTALRENLNLSFVQDRKSVV